MNPSIWQVIRQALVVCAATALCYKSSGAQDKSAEYGKRSGPQYTVRVYHGTEIRALSYQIGSGERTPDQPQPWLLEQGSQVCVDVVNANPVKYTYALAQVIDTTTPVDQKLPDIASVIAAAFGGTAAGVASASKAMAPPGKGTQPGKAVPGNVQGEAAAPSLQWLQTYTDNLKTLAGDLDSAKAISRASDLPEPIGQSEEPTPGHGLRWAKSQLLAMPSATGRIAAATLEQTLSTWESDAKRDAAKAAQDAKLEGEARKNWDSMVGQTLSALASLGSAIRSDWNSIRDTFAKAEPTWRQCTTLGPNPLEVRLSIKANGSDKTRATGSSLLSIDLDPYYGWRSVESAPLAFAVYTPTAEALSLNAGRVERTDASFRVRAGVVLLTNISAFGPRHERSMGLMLGVGVLDASSTTAGKADVIVGPVYRLRDILGVGVGFSLSQRDRRKEQVAIGQPLPADIASIDQAVENRWLPGIVLALSLKGYKF